MKQFMMYVFIVLVSAQWSINAQSQSPVTPLEKTVKQLDLAENVSDLKQTRLLFERLAMMEPSLWLPHYYLAYIDIELSFRIDDEKEKQKYLEESQTYLDKLKKMKVTNSNDLSEINTLRGYWYFAQMAINPAVNGPRYSGVIINCYSEALKLNPDNPRAILLNAHFQQNMAHFMNGAYPKFDEDVQKAQRLFEVESTESPLPHWGKNRKY